MIDIVSRKLEINELEDIYRSKKSEFVVVYGRRRVGKTFLIRELFRNRMAFYHTALSPIEFNKAQLTDFQIAMFCNTLKECGVEIDDNPHNWFDVFQMLKIYIKSLPTNKRQVVFIDELPWLDTKGSGFITAFEHFWNSFGDGCHNLMLIVCGSATTWISDKLLNNYGGLYNRITHKICLTPFTLGECEKYYQNKGIVMSRYDQLQCYMAIGGIPYYMSYVPKGKSVSQILNTLFFSKNARLNNEFERLCISQFIDKEKYKSILKLLSKKRKGYTRKEISQLCKIPYGGTLSDIIKALEVSDFIMPYTYFGGNKREVYYKLTDLFTLFWMSFMTGKNNLKVDFWTAKENAQIIKTWQGFAFEEVCFVHRFQIKRALEINGVSADFSTWRESADEKVRGAQVDMLINRSDKIIDLCEMKFYNSEVKIDKTADDELRRKLQSFISHTKTRATVHQILVTTYGLDYSEYSNRFQNVITMDDLFA
ncbi:MAG: ATP-binding protein [Bacteroidales bacterium]|nr:ATP-binding protein [Bacteroidales bacterium]